MEIAASSSIPFQERPAMAEFHSSFADVTQPGDNKPYGPPIRDAIASGDATKMRLQFDSAHRWLAANSGDPAAEDVRVALDELGAALKAL
jgi:hypothetical protein